MVIVDNFSVRLVDGTTKQPFPEHKFLEKAGCSTSHNSSIGSNNNDTNNQGNNVIHYVKAKPNTEFLIELGVFATNNDDNNNNNTNNQFYSFRSWVDGNPLGSLVTMRATHINPNPIQRVGMFAIQKGVRSMAGIRWKKKKPQEDESTVATATTTAVRLFQGGDNSSTNDNAMTSTTGANIIKNNFLGSITVQVLEAIPTGMKAFRSNYEPAFRSNTIANKDSCTEIGTTRELFASDETISSPGTLWKRGGWQGKRRAIVAATPPAKRHKQQRHATFTTGALMHEITIHYTMASGGPGDTGKQPSDKSSDIQDYLERALCDKENKSGNDDSILATPAKPKAPKGMLAPVVDEEAEWVVTPKAMILAESTAAIASEETMTTPKENDADNSTPTSSAIKPVTLATTTNETPASKGSDTDTTALTSTTIKPLVTMAYHGTNDMPRGNSSGSISTPTKTPAAKLDIEAVDQWVVAMKGTERHTDSPTDTTYSGDNSLAENNITEITSNQKKKNGTPTHRVVIISEVPSRGAPVPANPKSRSDSLTDTTCSLSSDSSRASKTKNVNVTLQETMVGTNSTPPSKPCLREPREAFNAGPSKAAAEAKSHRDSVVEASPVMDKIAIPTDSTPVIKDTHQQEPKVVSTQSSKSSTKNVRVGGVICITPRRSILLGGRGGKKKRKPKNKK